MENERRRGRPRGESTRPITVRVPVTLADRLASEAARQGRAQTTLIVWALKRFFGIPIS